MVIEELVARAAEQVVRPEAFFWRTQAGGEVDLLLVAGRRILPVEIKLEASVDHRAVSGLRQCMKDLGLRRSWVVCTAEERSRIGNDIEIVPWAEVTSAGFDLGLG